MHPANGNFFQAHVPAKEFINRETPRQNFYAAVEASSLPEMNVLMYYGIGGIGKSSLVKNLKDYTNNLGVLYTFVDFDDPAFRLPFKALIELKKNLNIPLPHFDVAVALCFIKRNPEIQFNDKVLSGNTAFKVIQSLSSLEPTGILGSVIGLTEIIYDKSATRGKLHKEVKSHLKALETKTANEIESELPDYFAYDVVKHLQKEKKDRCVFFFDTYELLWDKGRNESNRLKNDAWIRKLVSKLPQAIFVLSGREKIQWELEDDEWLAHINFVPIDVLDAEYAAQYLDVCNITDLDLQRKIIDSTQGHPYYLDLCVDTYYKLLNANRPISVDSFGRGRREIQELFLKNLSDSEINTLRVLVIPSFYDDSIFEYLVNAFHTGYSIVRMEDFNSFSFVKCDINRKYFIHVLMRDEIKSHMSDELKKLVNNKMVSYYENKLLGNTVFIDDLKYLFVELLYHLKASLTERGIADYLEQKQVPAIRRLQLAGETNYLLKFLKKIFYATKAAMGGTEFFSIMIDMIHLSGQYSEAAKIISEYLGSYSLVEIADTEYLLSLFIRKIHHKMFYSPLATLKHDLGAVLKAFTKKTELQHQYCEIFFMLGAHIYLPMGDIENAQDYLTQSIRIAKSIGSYSLMCRGLRKYVELLLAKGKISPAERICEYAIEIANSQTLTRYELYLTCVLGEINRIKGKTNTALKIFKEAFPIASSAGIKGWIGHILLSIGNCYLDLGDFTSAREHYDEASSVYDEIGQKWGIIYSDLMNQYLLSVAENNPDFNVLEALLLEAHRLGYGTIAKHIEELMNGNLDMIRFEFL